MCVFVCMHVCLYAFVISADSCANAFLPLHQHLPDLEYSVREKQLVDRTGLKLSTKANNVQSMAISWASILVSACCCATNPVIML